MHIRPARNGFALRCVNRDRAIAPVKRQKPAQVRLSEIAGKIRTDLSRDKVPPGRFELPPLPPEGVLITNGRLEKR